MRHLLTAVVAAAILAGCTDPNATDAYNQNVIDFWKFIVPAVLTAAGAAWAAWIAAKRGANSGVTSIETKLDRQQIELLEKTDEQTQQVVTETKQAAAQAAAKAVDQVRVDDGRRDRRSTDLKLDGGSS